MKDEQKVYIKGDPSRGDEVIKTLEDLGDRNMGNFDGKSTNIYYLINPDEVIGAVSIFDTLILPFIKEFYKEISLPRWKPKYDESYYRITWMGTVVEDTWYGSRNDESCYKFGNCFKIRQEAEKASNKIKDLLNNEQ